MKFNFPVNNFSSGEWSPKMSSRTDTAEYLKSCEEITNFFVQMQGGAQYRGNTIRAAISNAGLQYDAMNAVLSGNPEPTQDFKLIPYKFSDVTYATKLLIYGDGNFCTLEGTAVTGGSIPGWTPQGTQYQQVGDLLFLTHTSGNFPPKIFYSGSLISTVGYVISDAKLYQGYTAIGATYKPWWSIPFDALQALDANVSMTSPAVTTVGTDQTFTASANYFTPSMVGKYMRLAVGTTVDGIVSFKTYVSPTQMICNIARTMTASFSYGTAGNPTSFWQVSAWGADVGYPKTVTAFQGRLIYGGTDTKPDTIWGSRISNIFEFQEIPDVNTTGVGGYASGAFTSDNARPFTLTPNSAQSSNIVALSSSKTLNIHTDELEIVAYGSNGALGPLNVVFDSSSSFGSSPVQPVRVNNYATYVQANGYKVRDLTYNFSEDQYKSQDLGFVADHLFTRTASDDIDNVAPSSASELFPIDDIQEIVRYESRSSILFCKTRLGKLYYVTLDRDYQVNAWGRIVLGTEGEQAAPYEGAPKVITLCVDPVSKKVNLLTSRVFNGVAKLIWEVLLDPWEYTNNSNDTYNPYVPVPIYLDCAWGCGTVDPDGKIWTVDAPNPGADPKFSNAVVDVIADGSYVGQVQLGVDQEGTFTLTRPATRVYVGFRYPGLLKTNPIIQGGQTGTPQGRISRVDEMVVKLYRSNGCKIGGSMDSLEELPIRENSQPMNEATRFFTGDKVVSFPQDYSRNSQVIIKQDLPYPLYITSVVVRGVTYD